MYIAGGSPVWRTEESDYGKRVTWSENGSLKRNICIVRIFWCSAALVFAVSGIYSRLKKAHLMSYVFLSATNHDVANLLI